jgi:glycosyltransferase involved in cell wall biosynthesis
MLYPSLYEGFGMPVIEAMACGAPVVASASSSLPEAVGKFGRLVEPLDVEAWTAELLRAASDREWRDEGAKIARRAHALSFTWQGAAQATLQMYRMVAGG